MLKEKGIRKVTAFVSFALIMAGFAMSTLQAQDVTTIKITDKVLLKNTKRFGLNIGGHGAKSLKRRIRVNFEGSIHRRDVLAGPGCTDTKITTFMAKDWPELINSKGGTYTILSGPQKGMTGRIISGKVEESRWRYPSTLTRLEAFYSFTLEKPIAPLRWRDGVRLEVKHIKDGAMGGGEVWPSKIGSFSKDTPPGSWGYSSLEFSPKDKNGVLLKAGGLPESSAVVICSFWAKGVEASPTLTISDYDEKGRTFEKINLTNEWKQYSFKWKYPGKRAWIQLRTTAATRIDDISVDIEGYKNPTPFGDGLHRLLTDINPGIIRALQMSGGDVENFIRPKLQRYAATKEAKSSGSNYGYSNNDYYMLCEQLGMEPWYNLPGTVTKEGVLKYMEYVGAPADVGMAKIRAEYGHPKPWTETLKAIHVEFGNEIWNNATHYRACGYSGPDHWESIIKAAKASPYYKPNVIFHVGGRRYAAGAGPKDSEEEAEGKSLKPALICVAKNVPSADRYTWAPYILSAMDDKIIKLVGDDQGLLKYGFACAIDNALNIAGGRGEMFHAQEEIDKAGAKGSLSIYEINHHLTFGGFARWDKKKESLEEWALKVNVRERNMIMATLGGGVNVINAMLMHLKYNSAIDQCYFCYRGSGGSFDTNISVFSTHHDINADGSFRYNAKMKAMIAVNKALGGDLLETVHSGVDPVFSSFSRRTLKPVDNLPLLWSYAFKDGDKNSLIVVNLDLDNAQKVKVEHSDKGKNAIQYLVTADKFSDHNRQEEKVKIIEKKTGSFESGTTMEIPACSIMVVSWK